MPITRCTSLRGARPQREVDSSSISLVAFGGILGLDGCSPPEDKLEAQNLLNEHTNFLSQRGVRPFFNETSRLPELLSHDFVSSLPFPNYIRVTDLGMEIRSLQKALAYFLQTTSGVTNKVYNHVGAVGCDVVHACDSPQGDCTLNFRLAKNNGLQEEGIEFIGVVIELLEWDSGSAHSDEVERLALRHLLVRIDDEVHRICKRLWDKSYSAPKFCFSIGTPVESNGKDYLIVLIWLVDEYGPDKLHGLGVHRKIVAREGGRNPADETTEITKPQMESIFLDSSMRSPHLLQLHRVSRAACRLLHNQITSEVKDGLRRLFECLRATGNLPPLWEIKEEETIRYFPSVLSSIAEPLLQLEVAIGSLSRYRAQHVNAKVDVKFFALKTSENPTIEVRGEPMTRLTHCEMQILDFYLQRRPDNQLQGTRTRVGKFIGVSKDCCPLCSIVMRTLSGVFAVEWSHDNLSVWWALPFFLFSEDGLFSQHRTCFFSVVAHWADKHGYKPDARPQQ